MKKLITSLAAITVVVFGMYACDVPGMNSNNNDGGGAGPVITSQPRDTSVGFGEIATFTITAKDAISYKWVHNNTDTVYSGAPILAFLNGVEASDTGAYKCIVGNVSGATTVSKTVYLRISGLNDTTGNLSDLLIIQGPVDTAVLTGGSATFNVIAYGDASISYQWKKGATVLAGKTSSTLTLSGASTANEGDYLCVVKDSSGTLVTDTTHLYVIVPPTNDSANLEYDMTVLNLNQGTRKIAIREVDPYCYAGQRSNDTILDTLRYSISGGHLDWWGNGECVADVYNGSSATVTGVWTTSTFDQAALPAADRPSTCSATVHPRNDLEQGFYRNANDTLTVSPSTIHNKLAGKLCFADIGAININSISGVTDVAEDNCSWATFTNSDKPGRLAILTSSYQNGFISTTFKYGGKTCVDSDFIGLPGMNPDCSIATDYTDYLTCLDSTGFFPGRRLAKHAASAGHNRSPVKWKGF